MPELKQVIDRVEGALRACNNHEVVINDHLKGQLRVTLQGDRYDFAETHFNRDAKLALDQACLDYSEERLNDDEMRAVIKVLRDASEVSFIDGAIRLREPGPAQHKRMQVLFGVKPGERVVTKYDKAITNVAEAEKIEKETASARAKYLLDKFSAAFTYAIEEIKYRRRNNAVFVGDISTRIQKQFIDAMLNASRHGVKVTKEQRKLYDDWREIDLVTYEVKVPLTEINIEDIILQKDLFTEPIEQISTIPAADDSVHTHSCAECKKSFVCSIVYLDGRCPVVNCTPCAEKLVADTPPMFIPRDEIEWDTPTPLSVPVSRVSCAEFVSENVESHVAQSESLPSLVEPSPLPESEPEIDDEIPFSNEKTYVGTRIEIEKAEVEELTAEEKALGIEEDDLEADDDEPVQEGLFGDITLERVERTKMFSASQMIDAAFDYHRAQGFPYRDISPAMAMKELQELADTEGKALISTRLCYQVADTFHKHRLHAAANGMSSPFDSFNDDKKLRKAIRLELKLAGKPRIFAGGMMTLVNGTQACSNFRPGFASYLYREFCPDNAVVLDTSTGYGGRMLGAVASQKVSHYIGIDPNVPTYQANIEMIEKLQLRSLMEFTLYNLPAEDVDPELVRERCDFSFTSPPYFAKEIYSTDETQSWKRYSTGERWRDGFLKKMIELTFAALKHDTHAIINIADVKVKNKTYPLADWTRELGVACGFEYVTTEKFPMMTRFGKGMADEVAFEPVIVFKKGAKTNGEK